MIKNEQALPNMQISPSPPPPPAMPAGDDLKHHAPHDESGDARETPPATLIEYH